MESRTERLVDALQIDKELVLEFLVTFSRFEYSLKRLGCLKVCEDSSAEPCWDSFAKRIRGEFAKVETVEFLEAMRYISENPPKKQVVKGDKLSWDVTKWGGQYCELGVLRLVRRVRNNMFHGGKFPMGPIEDVTRNTRLLGSSLLILSQCLEICGDIRAFFEELPDNNM